MAGLSTLALRLLDAVGSADGEVDWKACREGLGADPGAFKDAVGELKGLVVGANPTMMRPPLRVTDEGRALLGRVRQGRPHSCLQLTLATEPEGNEDALVVTLADGGTQLRRVPVPVSSYRLAALRYLLVFDPDGLSGTTAGKAAWAIGTALLPPCPGHRDEGRPACSACVRGLVEGRLREAAAAGGWVRLELHVEPPWTYVPWEMATRATKDFVVLDPRVTLVRRLSRADRTGTLGGDLPVLVVAAKQRVPGEDAKLEREYATLRDATVDGDVLGASVRLAYATFADAAGLAAAVRHHRPRCVHVLGHGSPEGLAAAGGAIRRADVAAALAHEGVELVILSSCFGATAFRTDRDGRSLATMVAEHVESVVAFEGQADATHALEFARELYASLATVGSVEAAVRAGRTASGFGSLLHQFGQVVLFGR